MAKIKIKTDKVEINLSNVKTNEFNGAWQWVMDVLEKMNGTSKTINENNRPYSADELIYYLNAYQIKNTACSVIDDLYANMVKKDYLKDIQHYDVDLLGKIPFEVICDRLLDERQLYPPKEAAKLTGKIVAQFFYEQSKKGTPLR